MTCSWELNLLSCGEQVSYDTALRIMYYQMPSFGQFICFAGRPKWVVGRLLGSYGKCPQMVCFSASNPAQTYSLERLL
jgi:hypothetical protein